MNPELIYLCRILIAIVVGFFIGFERKLRFKEAGIRTHTIVCAGAALIMIVSKYGFSDFADFDPSRVASQIVSGISFIGAGMIIYRKQSVHGLTTAAGVWATAGVGMAVGSGLYIVSVGATLLLILFQCFMHTRLGIFKTKKYVKLKICFEMIDQENEVIKKLFAVERFARLNVARKDDKVYCTAIINTDKNFSDVYINGVLKQYNFIDSIERCDDD